MTDRILAEAGRVLEAFKLRENTELLRCFGRYPRWTWLYTSPSRERAVPRFRELQTEARLLAQEIKGKSEGVNRTLIICWHGVGHLLPQEQEHDVYTALLRILGMLKFENIWYTFNSGNARIGEAPLDADVTEKEFSSSAGNGQHGQGSKATATVCTVPP